ncbi:hypothetical protein [Glaciimonas sp. PAMC28666]|uniref:hypothetical protein n=1 Tax=Glaciimonas sp. PAMC28666 TaxID=2807626 RepID=UPI00196620AA|nr:hypothetical protein [Glaciimonas sp. PAMC28666]QRX84079.1 hypothetical protein JQN73_07725 [Glaciimonas sp. PAMC28666]
MQENRDIISSALRVCRESAGLNMLDLKRVAYFGKQGVTTSAQFGDFSSAV